MSYKSSLLKRENIFSVIFDAFHYCPLLIEAPRCLTLNPSLLFFFITLCLLVRQSLSLTFPFMHNNNSCEGAVRIKTTSAALVSANYTDSTILLSGE